MKKTNEQGFVHVVGVGILVAVVVAVIGGTLYIVNKSNKDKDNKSSTSAPVAVVEKKLLGYKTKDEAAISASALLFGGKLVEFYDATDDSSKLLISRDDFVKKATKKLEEFTPETKSLLVSCSKQIGKALADSSKYLTRKEVVNGNGIAIDYVLENGNIKCSVTTTVRQSSSLWYFVLTKEILDSL
jgi:hypothetical protein